MAIKPLNPCCRQKVNLIKNGKFYRHNDAHWVQRFVCKVCGKKLSSSSLTLEFWQKKRRINVPLKRLLCSGVSMTRSARLLKINLKTVARRLIYFGMKSRFEHERFLKHIPKKSIAHVQLDDLITKENSKLKPLSVGIMVDPTNRVILGVKVAIIPGFGHLAKEALARYGKRANQHPEKIEELITELKPYLAQRVFIESDEHKTYDRVIRRHLPHARHLAYPGGRGAVVGQGELKKLRFDPLFTINHTCAMLRANMSRLIRKTWCTTKDPKRLKDHLDLFITYYNQVILN
jgi:transposase-like protein